MKSTTELNELLFVVGMHRSGTSALCAALAACGASFGDRLIDAMAGVNDEGFWEDAGVVQINEQLLALTDSSWFAPLPDVAGTNWNKPVYAALREQALKVLAGGFGSAKVQVVKDPRFCLTLPFWLPLCDDLGITARVCVIGRAPLEVARSLEKRDGFPVGYALRLCLLYRACIQQSVPSNTLYVRFDDLLHDPEAAMASIGTVLPLPTGYTGESAVRSDLRHQLAGAGSELLTRADSGEIDIAALQCEIEAAYPWEQTLRDFANTVAIRGRELEQIGGEHTAALVTLDQRDRDIEALSAEHRQALATVNQRDADIDSLSGEHRAALATIDERDEQIREFDRRLSQLGEEHSHALQTLRERDAELAWIKQRLDAVSKVPGVGYLIRRLRKHAQG